MNKLFTVSSLVVALVFSPLAIAGNLVKGTFTLKNGQSIHVYVSKTELMKLKQMQPKGSMATTEAAGSSGVGTTFGATSSGNSDTTSSVMGNLQVSIQ